MADTRGKKRADEAQAVAKRVRKRVETTKENIALLTKEQVEAKIELLQKSCILLQDEGVGGARDLSDIVNYEGPVYQALEEKDGPGLEGQRKLLERATSYIGKNPELQLELKRIEPTAKEEIKKEKKEALAIKRLPDVYEGVLRELQKESKRMKGIYGQNGTLPPTEENAEIRALGQKRMKEINTAYQDLLTMHQKRELTFPKLEAHLKTLQQKMTSTGRTSRGFFGGANWSTGKNNIGKIIDSVHNENPFKETFVERVRNAFSPKK